MQAMPGLADRQQSDIFAPPKAVLTRIDQVGGVFAAGKLVRMERDGSLPDRCVACNQPADGHRLSRTAYWTRATIRWLLIAVPFLLPSVVMLAGAPIGAMLFWPLALLMVIVNAFVRKKVTIDLGECSRHARMRSAVHAGTIACTILTVVLAAVSLTNHDYDAIILPVMFAMVPVMLILALVHGQLGAQKVALARVDGHLLWLRGCGSAFRDALPGAPP